MPGKSFSLNSAQRLLWHTLAVVLTLVPGGSVGEDHSGSSHFSGSSVVSFPGSMVKSDTTSRVVNPNNINISEDMASSVTLGKTGGGGKKRKR